MIKGDRIFWDLDGVLRKLSWSFSGDWPSSWDQSMNNKNLIEHINQNLDHLLECPECEYIDVARECVPLHIVSLQPDNWRKNTSKWLDIHLPQAKVKYVSKPDHKLEYLKCGTRILIEDYPGFYSYENIILIDRPYNRHIDDMMYRVEYRVTNPDRLREILIKYSGERSL